MSGRTVWLLRLGLGVAIIAAIAWFSDPAAIARHLSEADWRIAAPAIAGVVGVHLVGAATWRLLGRGLAGVDLPWWLAARLYYAAQAIGTLTPGAVGGDAYRMWAMRPGESGWRAAALPVIAQRVLSYVSAGVLAAAAAFVMPVPATARIALLAVPALAIAAGGAAWVIYQRRWSAGARATTPAVVRRVIAIAAAQSVAFHALAAIFGLAIILSLDSSINLPGALAALMVIRVAAILPLTPAGIGFQEGAFALLLPQAGVSAEAALAASALNRVAMLVTLAIGFAMATDARAEVAQHHAEAPSLSS